MKICKVAFENINSLAGKWCIDFESGAFDDGLFLITGDTGSGKTTILDAVSLALYGCTVREDVSKNRNEVMTRGRGTAWAEVEFTCGSGRYRSRWEQSRARGKARGALQGVKMFLFDVAGEKDISEHRVSDTQKKTEEKIGLSFGQFQRTMMLAQGKFDQFLSAKESERSEILEQATGTEIYSRVGDAIFQKKREADEAVTLLQTRLGESVTMEDSVRAGFESELLSKRETAGVKNAALESAKAILDDYNRKKLANNMAHDEVIRRNQIVRDCEIKSAQAAELVGIRESAVEMAESLKSEKEPVIALAITLKQQLQLDEHNRLVAENAVGDAGARLKTLEENAESLKKKIAVAKALSVTVGQALEGVFTRPDNAVAAKDPLVRKSEKYVGLAAGFARKSDEIARLKAVAEDAAGKSVAIEENYRLVMPGLKASFENARKALELAMVVDRLEIHRKNLEDGRPCPLCGALEHPYAIGNKPEKSECQMACDAARRSLDDLESKRNDAIEKRSRAESALKDAESAAATEKELCERLKSELDHAGVSLATQIGSDESLLIDAAEAIRLAQIDVENKKKSAHEALLACAGTRRKLEDLKLGKDPDELRRVLQNALDAAGKAASFARSAAATAVANLENAKTEAGKALDLAGESENAFNSVAALIPDPDKQKELIVQLGNEKKILDDAIGEITVRLNIDDEKKKRKEGLVAELEKAEDTKVKWTNLNNWLGGMGGEKFKRYAQGITLRQLLTTSNPHLSAMTQGRYELVWEPEETDALKLLPSVVDNDQGGETRPVTNLSGGERFQISLALALGLSEMSSARISVDSLFLDEGFGTLDGKTLEAALDTLCRIQQNGKLIGIISHVTEVAERISTQIAVRKSGGGLSVLEGAGVFRLS